MEFTHRAEQLSSSISDYERLIGENSLRIEQIRVQSQEVTEQLEELTKECVELDLEVREQREELEPLEIGWSAGDPVAGASTKTTPRARCGSSGGLPNAAG